MEYCDVDFFECACSKPLLCLKRLTMRLAAPMPLAPSDTQDARIFGHALLPDLKLPMIATRDVGNYAAQRLLDLDFSGKQTRELLGERDLSMTEAAVIARGIGKPELRYEHFPYDQMQQALTQMGLSPKKAAVYIEMFRAIAESLDVSREVRRATCG